ncbi:acetyl-CoA synthetase [Haloferax sp. DFSO52]|uniref:acetyl-CoA synthetase n=1 Tax=Haloferax sp. DFSO52 TaxID=3388505 RepID=UPI003A877D28
MDVIGDLMARDRRSDSLALQVDGPGRTYTYYDFITTSYKAGNVLRYLGVRKGARVAVEPVALPEPILTFVGAAQLGAQTVFDPTADARAVLVDVARESEFDLPPGRKLAVYNGPPDSPSTTHWEKEVWSENPAVHPEIVEPGDVALVADGHEYTHGDLLTAAQQVVSEYGLDADDTVVIRSSLSHPGTVVAGILAPLLAGGTIRVPDGDAPIDDAVAVGDSVPEARSISPDDAVRADE